MAPAIAGSIPVLRPVLIGGWSSLVKTLGPHPRNRGFKFLTAYQKLLQRHSETTRWVGSQSAEEIRPPLLVEEDPKSRSYFLGSNRM